MKASQITQTYNNTLSGRYTIKILVYLIIRTIGIIQIHTTLTYSLL